MLFLDNVQYLVMAGYIKMYHVAVDRGKAKELIVSKSWLVGYMETHFVCDIEALVFETEQIGLKFCMCQRNDLDSNVYTFHVTKSITLVELAQIL